MVDVISSEVTGSVFVPQPDITVAELADILKVLLDYQETVFTEEGMKSIPESCHRHFVSKQLLNLKKSLLVTSTKS